MWAFFFARARNLRHEPIRGRSTCSRTSPMTTASNAASGKSFSRKSMRRSSKVLLNPAEKWSSSARVSAMLVSLMSMPVKAVYPGVRHRRHQEVPVARADLEIGAHPVGWQRSPEEPEHVEVVRPQVGRDREAVPCRTMDVLAIEVDIVRYLVERRIAIGLVLLEVVPARSRVSPTIVR